MGFITKITSGRSTWVLFLSMLFTSACEIPQSILPRTLITSITGQSEKQLEALSLLNAAPTNALVTPGSSVSFKITGGTPPYVVTLLKEDGQPATEGSFSPTNGYLEKSGDKITFSSGAASNVRSKLRVVDLGSNQQLLEIPIFTASATNSFAIAPNSSDPAAPTLSLQNRVGSCKTLTILGGKSFSPTAGVTQFKIRALTSGTNASDTLTHGSSKVLGSWKDISTKSFKICGGGTTKTSNWEGVQGIEVQSADPNHGITGENGAKGVLRVYFKVSENTIVTPPTTPPVSGGTGDIVVSFSNQTGFCSQEFTLNIRGTGAYIPAAPLQVTLQNNPTSKTGTPLYCTSPAQSTDPANTNLFYATCRPHYNPSELDGSGCQKFDKTANALTYPYTVKASVQDANNLTASSPDLTITAPPSQSACGLSLTVANSPGTTTPSELTAIAKFCGNGWDAMEPTIWNSYLTCSGTPNPSFGTRMATGVSVLIQKAATSSELNPGSYNSLIYHKNGAQQNFTITDFAGTKEFEIIATFERIISGKKSGSTITSWYQPLLTGCSGIPDLWKSKFLDCKDVYSETAVTPTLGSETSTTKAASCANFVDQNICPQGNTDFAPCKKYTETLKSKISITGSLQNPLAMNYRPPSTGTTPLLADAKNNDVFDFALSGGTPFTSDPSYRCCEYTTTPPTTCNGSYPTQATAPRGLTLTPKSFANGGATVSGFEVKIRNDSTPTSDMDLKLFCHDNSSPKKTKTQNFTIKGTQATTTLPLRFLTSGPTPTVDADTSTRNMRYAKTNEIPFRCGNETGAGSCTWSIKNKIPTAANADPCQPFTIGGSTTPSTNLTLEGAPPLALTATSVTRGSAAKLNLTTKSMEEIFNSGLPLLPNATCVVTVSQTIGTTTNTIEREFKMLDQPGPYQTMHTGKALAMTYNDKYIFDPTDSADTGTPAFLVYSTNLIMGLPLAYQASNKAAPQKVITHPPISYFYETTAGVNPDDMVGDGSGCQVSGTYASPSENLKNSCIQDKIEGYPPVSLLTDSTQQTPHNHQIMNGFFSRAFYRYLDANKPNPTNWTNPENSYNHYVNRLDYVAIPLPLDWTDSATKSFTGTIRIETHSLLANSSSRKDLLGYVFDFCIDKNDKARMRLGKPRMRGLGHYKIMENFYSAYVTKLMGSILGRLNFGALDRATDIVTDSPLLPLDTWGNSAISSDPPSVGWDIVRKNPFPKNPYATPTQPSFCPHTMDATGPQAGYCGVMNNWKIADYAVLNVPGNIVSSGGNYSFKSLGAYIPNYEVSGFNFPYTQSTYNGGYWDRTSVFTTATGSTARASPDYTKLMKSENFQYSGPSSTVQDFWGAFNFNSGTNWSLFENGSQNPLGNFWDNFFGGFKFFTNVLNNWDNDYDAPFVNPPIAEGTYREKVKVPTEPSTMDNIITNVSLLDGYLEPHTESCGHANVKGRSDGYGADEIFDSMIEGRSAGGRGIGQGDGYLSSVISDQHPSITAPATPLSLGTYHEPSKFPGEERDY